MARHNDLGARGEEIATGYLLAEGYTIHRQDERMQGRGEIDIIAFKDNEVVFVEVKTRTEPVTDPRRWSTPAGSGACAVPPMLSLIA